MEEATERYVAFCSFICIVAFFLLGWPALVAWAGLAWGMQQFCGAMRGDDSKPAAKVTRHAKKPRRRCCK